MVRTGWLTHKDRPPAPLKMWPPLKPKNTAAEERESEHFTLGWVGAENFLLIDHGSKPNGPHFPIPRPCHTASQVDSLVANWNQLNLFDLTRWWCCCHSFPVASISISFSARVEGMECKKKKFALSSVEEVEEKKRKKWQWKLKNQIKSSFPINSRLIFVCRCGAGENAFSQLYFLRRP